MRKEGRKRQTTSSMISVAQCVVLTPLCKIHLLFVAYHLKSFSVLLSARPFTSTVTSSRVSTIHQHHCDVDNFFSLYSLFFFFFSFFFFFFSFFFFFFFIFSFFFFSLFFLFFIFPFFSMFFMSFIFFIFSFFFFHFCFFSKGRTEGKKQRKIERTRPTKTVLLPIPHAQDLFVNRVNASLRLFF